MISRHLAASCPYINTSQRGGWANVKKLTNQPHSKQSWRQNWDLMLGILMWLVINVLSTEHHPATKDKQLMVYCIFPSPDNEAFMDSYCKAEISKERTVKASQTKACKWYKMCFPQLRVTLMLYESLYTAQFLSLSGASSALQSQAWTPASCSYHVCLYMPSEAGAVWGHSLFFFYSKSPLTPPRYHLHPVTTRIQFSRPFSPQFGHLSNPTQQPAFIHQTNHLPASCIFQTVYTLGGNLGLSAFLHIHKFTNAYDWLLIDSRQRVCHPSNPDNMTI